MSKATSEHAESRGERIKSFLLEMATQDNRCTATPFYYTIRTEVEDSAPTDNCDFTRVHWQDESFESKEEMEKQLKDDGYTDDQIESALRESCEYGVRKRWEKRGMFLTESDAKSHLKLNYYHYSHNAHDYVEHAWRAPALEQFFKDIFEHFEIKEQKRISPGSLPEGQEASE